MYKFWAVLAHEYTRHVLRRRFLITLLALPLWLLFAAGMGVLSVLLVTDHAPVGYVDQAGLITRLDTPATALDLFARVPFQPYADEAQARAALDAEKIQAYLVLPPDYAASLDARLVFHHAPVAAVQAQIGTLLRMNLLAKQSPAVANRVLQGANLVVHATQGGKPAGSSGWVKTALPYLGGIFLMIAVFTSSGYLMQAVVEEKENRTMELLVTSASAGQIMGGKISALVLVGLTQMLAWSIVPIAGIYLVSTRTPLLRGMDWGALALVMVTILPTFVLISALMAAIGATITETHEGQQVSSLVTAPAMAPFFLSGLLALHPNGPLAVILSFFPLTASITLLIRLGFASVPSWQIVLSSLILLLSAAASLALAGRIFRAGMLRYGRRMGWRDVFRALDWRRAPRRTPPAQDLDPRKALPDE